MALKRRSGRTKLNRAQYYPLNLRLVRLLHCSSTARASRVLHNLSLDDFILQERLGNALGKVAIRLDHGDQQVGNVGWHVVVDSELAAVVKESCVRLHGSSALCAAADLAAVGERDPVATAASRSSAWIYALGGFATQRVESRLAKGSIGTGAVGDDTLVGHTLGVQTGALDREDVTAAVVAAHQLSDVAATEAAGVVIAGGAVGVDNDIDGRGRDSQRQEGGECKTHVDRVV